MNHKHILKKNNHLQYTTNYTYMYIYMYIQISYLHLNEFVSEWSIPPDDYLRKNGGNDDSPMAIHPGLGMYIYICIYHISL